MSFELFNAFKERGIRPVLPKPITQAHKQAEPTCQHDWQLYKQHVRVDNPQYKSSIYTWHFVIRACNLCHEKQYVDYKS